MNLVVSHPTSRGGGRLLLPVWGTAHIALGGRVYDVPLLGESVETLVGLEVDGMSLDKGEVWFEDIREAHSH
jgi:hypothetical protein